MRELRLFRRRIMVRIAWAQTLALVTEESILQQLSYLAETLIVAARDWLYDDVLPGSDGAFLLRR